MTGSAYAVEQAETERLLRRITPPLAIAEKKEKVKDEWYVDGFYEPSDILQGSSTGHWNEITTLFGYIHKNLRGYFSVSQLERFDNKDYTYNFGAYYSFKDCYFHEEIGFGWDVNYIYKFQNIVEYGHRLVKDVFWQIGYNYRGYGAGDTHVVYPGLIYYFGDNYMSADYGISMIEGRGSGSFGTVKGSFAITNFLNLYGGAAFGQWLYDIYGLKASNEAGYILFTGINMKVYKGINARFGYSYGTENPKFIKRSLDFGLSVKF
jgi:hypothetical protein